MLLINQVTPLILCCQKKRDKKAAKRFFIKAIGQHGLPEKITIDKSGSNKAALNLLNFILTFCSIISGVYLKILVRDIKYLNNIVKQDHRRIKKITKPMLGFKSFASAEATLAGIELHAMLKKEQHNECSSISVWAQFNALAALSALKALRPK